MSQCRRSGTAVDWFRITDDHVNKERVAAYVLKQWGMRYASPTQLVLSFGKLTRLIRPLFGWKAPVLNRERFFCSYLVAAAMRSAGCCCTDSRSKSPPLHSQSPPASNSWEPCHEKAVA